VTVRHVGRLEYSNVCLNACRHCGYLDRLGDEAGEVLPAASLVRRAEWLASLGVDTLQLVGGARILRPLSYYLETASAVLGVAAGLTVELFSASEIHEVARVEGRTLMDVLVALAEIGVRRITGDGADVLSPEVRRALAPRKLTAGAWLHAMVEAQELGLRSSAVMVFGHFETAWDKAQHLALLHDLQRDVAGFDAYAPQPLHAARRPGALNQLLQAEDVWRELAVGRMVLDSIEHVRSPYLAPLDLSTVAFVPAYGADEVECITLFPAGDEEPVVADVAGVEARLSDVGWRVARPGTD